MLRSADIREELRHTRVVGEVAVPFRLDYLSCILTIVSTILVAVNSVVICLIGLRTEQFGFIPANVFCIALYGINLRSWRKPHER
jgi:hypothetical protein